MRLEWKDMEAAAKAGLISTEQAKKVWTFWQKRFADTPQFRFSHVLYYFGGLLAISAVTLFVTRAWDSLVGMPLFLLSSLLFALGILLTHYFIDNKHRIPAGIMATFSLALVPLAVYNIQTWLGYSPVAHYEYADFHYWINWYWVPMELATLLVGVIMFYLYGFPFLLFPISVVLWYMSMDMWPLLIGMTEYSYQQRAEFSMYFGLMTLAAAIYVDFKHGDQQKDYAFWLYIFGVMTFWGGLTSQDSNSEISKFLYCMINVIMIFTSVFLDRRVFAVFGAIGILFYLGHLATIIFPDSLSFPIALVFLGILIIVLATMWQRIEKKMMKAFRPYIPKKILNRIDNK